MSIYDYARVSTLDQDFSIRHAALKTQIRRSAVEGGRMKTRT
jgi:hypothetical protein